MGRKGAVAVAVGQHNKEKGQQTQNVHPPGGPSHAASETCQALPAVMQLQSPV